MSDTTPTEVIDAEVLEATLAPEDPPAKVVPNPAPAKKAPAKPAAKKAPAKAPANAVAKTEAKTEVIEGELPLDKAQAEKLDKKIVTAVERANIAADNFEDRMMALADLVNEARAGQIHVGLGFASWTAYFDARVQLPVIATLAERRPVVALLHDAGMSQRDIAKQIGVSAPTVNTIVQELNASRPADSEASTKTVDKRGAVRDRAKASSAGKKAAAKKKSKDSGRASGKAPSQQQIILGDMLNLLGRTNAHSFKDEGQIKILHLIKEKLDKLIRDIDTQAANNHNAKA